MSNRSSVKLFETLLNYKKKQKLNSSYNYTLQISVSIYLCLSYFLPNMNPIIPDNMMQIMQDMPNNIKIHNIERNEYSEI